MEKKTTIPARQKAEKEKLIEALKKSAIVQLACQQANVSRATYYRWREDDPDFAKACDEAMKEGVALLNDLAESKLVASIKDQNYNAIAFWLRHRHAAYADKLQVQATVDADLSLSAEQEELVRRALNHVVAISATVSKPTIYEQHDKPTE